MCDRIFGPEHGCASRLSRYRLTVKPQSPVVNAHIDLKNSITVYGGLIRLVGSDDELAAVLAHEYAHGLFGARFGGRCRTSSSERWSAWPLERLSEPSPATTPMTWPEAATIGAETGQLAGVRAYSQAMENEADHVGLFILREAGYEMEAASHLHMRLLNATRSAPRGKEDPTLLYIRTHPRFKGADPKADRCRTHDRGRAPQARVEAVIRDDSPQQPDRREGSGSTSAS